MYSHTRPPSRTRTKLLRLFAMLSLFAGFVVLGSAQEASATPSCGVLASGAAAQANNAVTQACGLIGTPYSWGGGHGTTPGPTYGSCDASNGAPNDCHVIGLDCSGMVRYAYYLAVNSDVIPGPTYVQWNSPNQAAKFYASQGTAPLLPGDLVFFGTSSNIHHVAMYLGGGYIVESPNSGEYVQVAQLYSHSDYYGAIRLYGSSSAPSQYWVDTSPTAPVYATPTSTSQTGTLYAGTNYVFCKVWGRMIGTSSVYNHWWLKTDPDVGPGGQYVSAYYLSRWGNDEAKDNNGTVIPNC